VTRADVERAHRDLGWGPPEAHAALRPTARAAAELTDPLRVRAAGSGGDLDPEIDAVFELPAPRRIRRPRVGRAHAYPGRRTRAAAARDDVDDLFMELLDD
jgi:hypothetical protein